MMTRLATLTLLVLGLTLSTVEAAQAFLFGGMSAPRTFIPGHLKCAANVNAALAERGIQGTGSDLAKSFLTWGRPSAAVPGAVAVYDRGGIHGHAALVSRVEGGTVYVWNPNHNGWVESVYRKTAIAYRVASSFSNTNPARSEKEP